MWIIFWFHENRSKWGIIAPAWPLLPGLVHNKVAPPRLEDAKVGVFATRSPHRPNPIGLTAAKLEKIVRNTVYLSGMDLIDGTPVLGKHVLVLVVAICVDWRI